MKLLKYFTAGLLVVSNIFFMVPGFARASAIPVGVFDAADCSVLTGWAFDPDAPSSTVAIHVYADGPAGSGTLVLGQATDQVRLDVNSYFNISGNHGFSFALPDYFKDGKSHTVYAYAIDATGDAPAHLINSPKSISGCTSVVRVPAPTAVPLPANRPPTGYLEAANCSIIGGWAYDPDTSSSTISVHVYDGMAGSGTLLGAYETSGLRPDVNASLNISGNHGFTLETPQSLKDGRTHTIYAYGIDSAGGTNNLLGNSSLNCPAPTAVPTPVVTPTATPTATATPTPAPTTAPQPSPTPAPSTTNHAPTGYLEAATCSIIGGWAYDQDTSLAGVMIHVYDSSVPGAVLLGSYTTTGVRPDVNAGFGISGNHGFTLDTPTALKDGKTHTISAYALDSTNSSETLIGSQSLNCPTITGSTPTPIPTNPPPEITISSIPAASNGTVTIHKGDSFSISGGALNVNFAAVGSDFTRAFFFDHIFDNSCSHNEASERTWKLDCKANTVGTSDFSIEIYRNGQTYRSNVIHVVVSDLTPLTNVTPRNTLGYLDGVDDQGYLIGWAYDPDHSQSSVTVKIKAATQTGEALEFTSVTSELRSDVNRYFGISGNHGFKIQIPLEMRNGKAYTVTAFATDLDAQVGASPVQLSGYVTGKIFSPPGDMALPGRPATSPSASTSPAPLTASTTITIRAKGTPGAGVYPMMELRAGVTLLNAWHVTGTYADYTFTTSTTYPDNLRVYFTNDYFANGEDRNLTVDYITVNGKTYQSEEIGTFGKGIYVNGPGCVSGFQKGETLYCNNGYFEYPTLRAATVSALYKGLASIWNIFF